MDALDTLLKDKLDTLLRDKVALALVYFGGVIDGSAIDSMVKKKFHGLCLDLNNSVEKYLTERNKKCT